MKVFYFLIGLFILISCKREKIDSRNIDHHDSVNPKTAQLIDQKKTVKSSFSYEDLIGKTFFEVSEINNEYYYLYQDFNFDMIHHEFRFGKTSIEHLDPIEWTDHNVLKTETLTDKIKVNVSYPSGIQREFYFRYNKNTNTLRFSERDDFSESIVLFDKSKKDLVKYKSIKRAKVSFESSINMVKASGGWSIECDGLGEFYQTLSIDTDQKGAFLSPIYNNDFFVPCSYELKRNKLVFKLHPEASKTRFVDWNTYSKDSIVGYFGFDRNNNKAKLYWYGVYNNEKKKRDYHTITFKQEENEEGFKSPIFLEKCE